LLVFAIGKLTSMIAIVVSNVTMSLCN